ncbi:apolipoprotein N-acyltransferase [Caulobacter ginsengisoli]|uniref:Apolipoprotein N-acyltransferase n=1 Tax=Caulobacter ginsengisoli TaxID=400775 RepID=A0ABU0IT66_9CAUL|nr:apolipoprotein N-acyltransferase [Caulobacter ginsengisoli]MDQ0465206.1 apolipoprotein N-acyltransferase [Caulobacter ginsengisoli]
MTLPKGPWVLRGLALAAGLAAALAHPPFGLLPGLLGYAVLLWLVDEAPSRKSAFLRGWLAGLGYFALSMWWIAEAFLVDAANQGWMAPIAVTLMAGGLALFWGAAMAVYRAINPKGLARLLVFAGVLALFEWLRGHVLTGLPWNLVGETWRAGSAMSQTASLVGAYGLTWLTLAIAAAPALLIAPADKRRARIAVGAAALALAGLWIFGALALAAKAPPATGPLVRIVQANVPQLAKYDAQSFAGIVDRYIRGTVAPAKTTPDVVIWSEGAIPAAIDEYLAPGTWTRDAIQAALKPGQVLIVGAYRIDGPRYYNSLAVVRRDADGLTPIGLYDKYRLVPFGEFMPLDSVMGRIGFKKLVHVGDGFSIGPRPRPLTPPGLPAFQPLICYESLYPGFTREGAARTGVTPRWIVNVSNDAWFGTTSGPLQHLNLASYRAIEEGLPMVRVTPTGVSALIDARGRILRRLEQGQEGVIDARLPAPLAAPTLFRRLGDWCFFALLLISLAAGVRWPLAKSRNRAQDTERGVTATELFP